MKSIIFNTEEVQAILDGMKKQKRKAFSKTQLKYFDYAQKLGEMNSLENLHENDFSYILQFSKYKIDDILYVKETFNLNGECWGVAYPLKINYKANSKENNFKWISSNNMRKEYARIFLKVTNVRVERLQDINEEDCLNEGIIALESWVYDDMPEYQYCLTMNSERFDNVYEAFSDFWNSTAKDGYKWEDNPYVFVYEFEMVKN